MSVMSLRATGPVRGFWTARNGMVVLLVTAAQVAIVIWGMLLTSVPVPVQELDAFAFVMPTLTSHISSDSGSGSDMHCPPHGNGHGHGHGKEVVTSSAHIPVEPIHIHSDNTVLRVEDPIAQLHLTKEVKDSNKKSNSNSNKRSNKNSNIAFAPNDKNQMISPTGVDPNATCDQLIDHFHRISEDFHKGDVSVAPPLINYGFYGGQGFGRLIDHSVYHCLLSLALDRPCLVDLSDRDPFYTWRAFIHTGTYDWEMEVDSFAVHVKPAVANLSDSVRTAIQALRSQADGQWEDPVPQIENMFLMEQLRWFSRGKTDRKKYFRHIQAWRAENIPKALLSPNWGGAWFSNLSPPAWFGQCHRKELLRRIQNAMYAPTPLSRKLHQEYQLQVLKPPIRPYGAIHIRFVILQIQNLDHSEDSLLPSLTNCLHRAVNQTGLADWWLISDKLSRAVSLAEKLPANLNIHFATETQNDTQFTAHSSNHMARGLFGHAYMKTSIVDWMVLHESQSAIVTMGSYGDTGARGRGKDLDGDSCGIFSLYH